MEYLKVFETIDEQQSYLNGDIIKPSVTIARNDNSTISYVPKVPKKVNHGTINSSSGKLMWEYPVASDLTVKCETDDGVAHSFCTFVTTLGSSINAYGMLMPEETIVSVMYINPPEDDTYIYEIII